MKLTTIFFLDITKLFFLKLSAGRTLLTKTSRFIRVFQCGSFLGILKDLCCTSVAETEIEIESSQNMEGDINKKCNDI